jgi:hypothetical protein
MTKPQQPELARSGRSEVDPHSAKTRTGGPTDADPAVGPVPEDNLPGHHPEHEQDKPDVRPLARPRGRRAAATPKAEPAPAPKGPEGPKAPRRHRFGFAFDPRLAVAALPFGVTPFTASVEVADGELHARFGPWSVRTPVDNVASAEVTGPYSWPKVIGPPHLSFRDRGVTFATTTERGVCIRFRQPVSALLPGGLLKHPGLTVTVDRPDDLVAALAER